MKNNKLNRRVALKLGAMSAAGAAMTSTLARAAAASSSSSGKVLLINLRGGWDGLHVVIPNGTNSDPDYLAPTTRPTLKLDFNQCLSIEGGNTFCSMHPSLGRLSPLLSNNRLVFLHGVGLRDRTGSHFEDQRTVETGMPPGFTPPAGVDKEDGWMTRALGSGTEGISVSNGMQQLFQTQRPGEVLPNIRRIMEEDNSTVSYTLNTSMPTLDGAYKGNPTGSSIGHGLAGHYEFTPQVGNSLDELSRAHGRSLLASEDLVGTMTQSGVYAPSNMAEYPLTQNSANVTPGYPTPPTVGLINADYVRTFMRNLRDAVWLLKQTSVRVVGIELGGWDTHGKQGQLTGNMPERLKALAYALETVDKDLGGVSSNVTTLCISEFGRTGAENGGNGTDHGAGSVVIAMGPQVQLNTQGATPSRVFGCDAATWPGTFSANFGNLGLDPMNPVQPGEGRFVSPRISMFGVLAELMECGLGVSPGLISTIMPGFDPMKDAKPGYLQ